MAAAIPPSMTWNEMPGRFALVGLAAQARAAAPPAFLAELLSAAPRAEIIVEHDETTVLLEEELLSALLARCPDASVERDLVWIRFEAALAWDVVGFLALVCSRLAQAGVPVGAICGYSRDSLFLAAPHLEAARSALGSLFPRAE